MTTCQVGANPYAPEKMKLTLPESVHKSLSEKLLNGSLPPGTRLDYKQLAIELGVSTTPVREAVTRLASEGLVELIPRLGAVVRSITQASAIELYEVREAVETFASLKAAERISPRILEVLRDNLKEMTSIHCKLSESGKSRITPTLLRKFLDLDLDFHRAILFGARNKSLSRTVEESHLQSRIFYADRGIHDIDRIKLACEQHEAILAALEKHDGKGASEAMSEHIRASLAFTLSHLETRGEI